MTEHAEYDTEAVGSPWVPVWPAPVPCPLPPPRSHPKRGEPVDKFPYFTQDAQPLGWVYEFADSHGEPVRLPLVWATHRETGESMWRWMAFPAPRPLFNLMDLNGDVAVKGVPAPVIVFPCEADAAAASQILSKGVFLSLDVERENAADIWAPIPCLSWPGGPGTALKADWSAIQGRVVYLFPPYTCKRKALSKSEREAGINPLTKPFLKAQHQPGWRAAGKIAEILVQQSCDVHLVQLPEPGDQRDGWGVRQLIADGLGVHDLFLAINKRLRPFSPSSAGTDKNLPDQAKDSPSVPEFEGVSPPSPAGAGRVETGVDWSWLKQRIMKDDKPVDCRENVHIYLTHHPDLKGVVWADTFARKIVMRRAAPWVEAKGFEEREWEEADDLDLGLWLAQQDRLLLKAKGTLADGVVMTANKAKYNPVQDYFDSLAWDGVPRLTEWLTDYLGVEKTEYAMLVGKMFLVGVAARVYRPGCILRTMPIFEGTQFRGKSTALRILGGKWFSDTPLDFANKDWYQNIQGRLIYEIAELDAFSRSDVTRVKAAISSPSDNFRAPYDRRPKDNPRQTVFTGTTNQHEYFRDKTGNTRFWPVAVEQVDAIKLGALEAARDQLFAEARACFLAGERWYPSGDEQRLHFDQEQADREIGDPWEGLIRGYLNTISRNEITTDDILTDGLKIEPGKIDRGGSMATSVGIAMARLGWKKARRMVRGQRVYYYVRPAGGVH